jgi:hypothetical protein
MRLWQIRRVSMMFDVFRDVAAGDGSDVMAAGESSDLEICLVAEMADMFGQQKKRSNRKVTQGFD